MFTDEKAEISSQLVEKQIPTQINYLRKNIVQTEDYLTELTNILKPIILSLPSENIFPEKENITENMSPLAYEIYCLNIKFRKILNNLNILITEIEL